MIADYNPTPDTRNKNVMKPNQIIFIILLIPLLWASPALSQVKNVNVSELTDDQIMQLMTEVEKMGMSMEDAASLARMRGASEEQISEIMGRIAQNNFARDDSLMMKREREGEVMRDEEYDFLSQKEPVDTVVAEKKIFGFDLFNNKNLTFEPGVDVQTPRKYIVGIGDEFIINVWGATEAMYQSEVDKNGTLNIPLAGPVFVNGMSFEKAERLIKNRLIRIHGGLAGNNPDTYAIVNLEGMKSMQVTIVGEVMTPGTFTLPATATLFNALYLSGGPNEFGSYRDIRLMRDGEILKNVDIYQFIVNADPTQNIPLRDQDIIFIPRYDKRIIVEGEFVRTGLFELKGEESLADLLNYNAGFADNAYKQRVFVHSQTGEEREVTDVAKDQFDQYILMGGDSVIAEPIIERYANRVKIGGAIFREGNYQLSEGMTLIDLINKAEGLREDAYMDRGQIFRLSGFNDTLTVAFDVTAVMAGDMVISLQREDSVSIKPESELHEKYTIEIQGQVNEPGEKSYYHNMSVEDLIFLAGGFTKDAANERIEIARRLEPEAATYLNDSLGRVFTIRVDRNLKPNLDNPEFKLAPFDRVLVRKAVGYRDQGSVSITGEVYYVGYYSIKNRDDRISDLINWSKGFTPDAYPEAANLFRFDSTLVDIDLKRIMADQEGDLDMILEPGDSLYIPKKPQTVNIVGQVQAPFATTFIENRSLKYYIKNAGGWAEDPDRSRIYVTYPDGSSANTKSFIFRRYPRVKPGGTIYIPRKPVKTKKDNSAAYLALATTMSSIGVAVATMVSMLNSR